jgi:hypothetical protein
MPKSAATQAPLLLLLGGTLIVAACNGSNPTSAPGATGAASGTPGAASAAGASSPGGAGEQPHAAPGLGQNPTVAAPAAPPPPAGVAAAQVAFSDPNNMPFIDPLTDTDKASNVFFLGTWGYNGGFMEQSTGAKQASLSFRQYSGNAFGTPDGTVSSHYRADVTAWVYQPSDQYPNMVGAPLGIIGYCPYFRDASHYMLAVAKPTGLEVWAVDGFVPGTVWPINNLLFSRTLATPLAVGSPVAWSVEINTAAQQATISANGEQVAQVTHAMLGAAGAHVALVSNGNYVHYQDFKLYKM